MIAVRGTIQIEVTHLPSIDGIYDFARIENDR